MSESLEKLAGPSKGVVLATMFMLFSMIQFLLNFAGAMGVVIQNQFGVSNALAQLGPAALRLRLFAGLSYKEIADVFGKTENWARVTYHRARLKLRERIGEQ